MIGAVSIDDGVSIKEKRNMADKSRYFHYDNSKRKKKSNATQYRQGPVPLANLDSSAATSNIETLLDSDLEDNEALEKNLANGKSLPGSRGLLTYFARLSGTPDGVADLYFMDTLIKAGADVNFTDRHGQTMMHAIAKDWSIGVAKFFIERGANMNLADRYGRTPLHVAAAFDYTKMVEFLVENGAYMEAQTKGEQQTPTHYAAKKNSVNALKALIRLGGNINTRDYKNRTPLFVAAELGRNDAVKYLLDIGAPAGVYDTGGNSAVAVMIEKMPDNAKTALDQFLIVDRALRKSYFYLNYMEQDRTKQKVIQKHLAKTPLELIVFYQELDLVTNPVVQKLMEVKWKLFGFKYTVITLMINLLYTVIWTVLGFTLPRSGKFYDNLKDVIWVIVLESLLLLFTLYFIIQQVLAMKKYQSVYSQWKDWKIREIEKDLQYCHSQYPSERRFLMNEIGRLRRHKGGYFNNFWNVFEWICLVLVLILIATRAAYTVYHHTQKTNASLPKILNAHKIMYAVTLLLIWLRMMKVFQGFQFLAAFITLLGHVAADTLKFAFLFFEFFIPFVCTFWMMFGGTANAKIIEKAGDNANSFSTIPQTAMTVWTMTFVGDFPFQGMVAINEILAQVLTSAYWALVSLVCLNLYIALMSETFSRVYSNAQANADLQQASLLISFEEGLTLKEKKALRRYINRSCGPLEEFTADQGSGVDADAVGNTLDEIQKEVDRVQSKLEETSLENETRIETLQNSVKALRENSDFIKRKIIAIQQQQNALYYEVSRSGIRGVMQQGGEALDNLRERFNKLIRKDTDSTKSAVSDAGSDSTHDDSAENLVEPKQGTITRTHSAPNFEKLQ